MESACRLSLTDSLFMMGEPLFEALRNLQAFFGFTLTGSSKTNPNHCNM